MFGRYFTQEQLFQTMRYPAGETHSALLLNIARPEYYETITIEAHPKNFEDICTIVTQHEILRRNYKNADNIFTWFIPYMPFARQDRRESSLDGLELDLVIKLLDGINVVCVDPHSEVSGRFKHIPQSVVVQFLKDAHFIDKNTIFVIPDAGASKKAKSWIGTNQYVQALKTRDPMTGKLSGFSLVDPSPLNNAQAYNKVVIVDDICDAGGTFLGLLPLIRRELEKSLLNIPVSLMVSHGLFTKGIENVMNFDGEGCSSKFDFVLGLGKGNLFSYEKLYRYATEKDII